MTNHDQERAAFNAEYENICNRQITGREIAWRMWQARAALNASRDGVAVPDGWRLVPVKPTERMLMVARGLSRSVAERPGGEYRALVAAAPTPPASDHSEDARQMVPADVRRDIERLVSEAIGECGDSRTAPDHAVNVGYWLANGASSDAVPVSREPDAVKVPRELLVRLNNLHAVEMDIDHEVGELRALLAKGGDV
nr:hypothetical protein [uncultured Pseudomonas sp.]